MTNPLQRRPTQDGRHTPNLWPVWLVAPGALLIVGAAAFGLYHGAEFLLSSESARKKPVGVQDVIKTTVTVLTLIGAVLAALYAYRKQLLDEGTSRRADSTQLTERYTKAAEQLGHDQAAVRLAGVYAMARLADDWPEQRQVCVDVLCAYLRMPYETDTIAPGFRHGEREVRLTIIRTIRNHLQHPTADTTWCGLNLDFTGAAFDGGDFSGATFSGGKVSFNRSVFSAGDVDFSESKFSGAEVTFFGARFSGGQVSFSYSTFSGGRVYFVGSQLTSGQFDFFRASFSGGEVTFTGASFSGCRVYFSNSTFSGGQVYFSGSTYSGGQVYFGGSTFSGGEVSFSGSTYSGGQVYFGGSKFSGGEVSFTGSTYFGGEVSFSNSMYSGGQVDFSNSMYSGGQVDFRDSILFGGTVKFDDLRVLVANTIRWGPFPAISRNQ
ncbi:pentapeptide repeat-containing protein [Streptomyces cyaneofuscatus]|uniref:pentapeptide repeat-containing protein n=1 Tax=Streptomyces cyaneofuscatus TaxID=66883 RepID=UPI00341CEC11